MDTSGTRRPVAYTEEEKASALAVLKVNGGNVAKTADVLGIPRTTLISWRDSVRKLSPATKELRAEKNEAIAARFEALVDQLLGVVEVKADDMNGRDAMLAAGVATDKMRLLRDETTEIVGGQSPEERDAMEARTQRARERYGPRKPGQPALPGGAKSLPASDSDDDDTAAGGK